MVYKLNSNICHMFADAPSFNEAHILLCLGNVEEGQVRNELYEQVLLQYSQYNSISEFESALTSMFKAIKSIEIHIVNPFQLESQTDKRPIDLEKRSPGKPWAILGNDEVLSLTTLTVYKMVDKGLREYTQLKPISEGQLKDILAKHGS